MEEQKLIYKIEDVKVGDYAHYKGYERGLKVIKISKTFDGESLKVELPGDFFISLYMGDTEYLNDSAFLFASRGYDALEQENQVPESDKITNIEDVQVGDIAYFEGSAEGAVVVGVDSDKDDGLRLQVEPPEGVKAIDKAFDLSMFDKVWLRNSSFKHAIRPTQNKQVDKRLPAVQERYEHIFETQEGVRIIYGGLYRGWRIESFLSDKRLLGMLDQSQFPLKDMMEEG